MPENLLIPSVDLRIGSLEEYNRRQKEKAAQQHHRPKPRPCLTISREFGCEGYPVAELLRELMMQRTGDEWVLIDKAILEVVAQRHNISEDILQHLGDKNHILDEVLATFSHALEKRPGIFSAALPPCRLPGGTGQCHHHRTGGRHHCPAYRRLLPFQAVRLHGVQGPHHHAPTEHRDMKQRKS